MTDQCKAGGCIVGEIANRPILEKDWARESTAFQMVIEDWNVKTRRFAIPHPGFCYASKYCAMCGRPLKAFHDANPY